MDSNISRRALIKTVTTLACAATVGPCLAMLSGCSSYRSVDDARATVTAAPTIGSPTIRENGVLTVGIDTTDAPYCWVADAATGRLDGLDADMAIALGDALGLTVRFVNVDGDMGSTVAGTCDVMMGAILSAAPEDQSIVVLGSYAGSAPAVFAQTMPGVVTLDQLASAPVAVQSGSASEATLANVLPQVQPQGFASLNDAFSALANGLVSYVVCDSFMGGYLCANSFSGISCVGAFQLASTRGVAVSGANSTLRQAVIDQLNAISSNGIQDRILAKYVGNMATITPEMLIYQPAPVEAPPAEEWVEQPEEEWEG